RAARCASPRPGAGGAGSSRPPLLRALRAGYVQAEIHVGLHARHQRAGIGEIDQHFHHVDVAELARPAGIDPARPDDLIDRDDLALELTVAERIRAYEHPLADADF